MSVAHLPGAHLPGARMAPETLLAILLERANRGEFVSVMVSVEYTDETFGAFYSSQKTSVTLCHATSCRALAEDAFFDRDNPSIVHHEDDGA